MRNININEVIEFAKERIECLGGGDAVLIFLMLYLMAYLTAQFFPWSDWRREYLENLHQAFLTAAGVSAMCGLYVSGVIGKYLLAFLVVLIFILQAAVVLVNVRIAKDRKDDNSCMKPPSLPKFFD